MINTPDYDVPTYVCTRKSSVLSCSDRCRKSFYSKTSLSINKLKHICQHVDYKYTDCGIKLRQPLQFTHKFTVYAFYKLLKQRNRSQFLTLLNADHLSQFIDIPFHYSCNPSGWRWIFLATFKTRATEGANRQGGISACPSSLMTQPLVKTRTEPLYRTYAYTWKRAHKNWLLQSIYSSSSVSSNGI